jgi:prepilin-type N-terminal cleavage/methylation domain-containing protein
MLANRGLTAGDDHEPLLKNSQPPARRHKQEATSMVPLTTQRQAGFTLIELLLVVAIVGILAAIAIPQFAAYRKRSFEAQVKSDLRNAASAQEGYFAQHVRYQDATPATTANLPGFDPTPQVTVAVSVPSGEHFTLTATHAHCGAASWVYDNLTGVITGGVCP